MNVLPRSELLQKYANIAGPASAGRGAAARVEAPGLASGEASVLAQERAIRASASGATTSVTYKYAIGPDGQRYIVGADVTITGSEEAVDRVGGGTKRESIKPAAEVRSDDQNGKDTAAASGEERAEPREAEPSADDDPEVRAQVERMKQIEREVIAHEAAHMAAGGQFAGGVSYTYAKGPDGRSYIVGGEVPISLKSSDNPHETIANASQVMRAALAPGDPSGPDIAVAAAAAQMQAQARAELARQGAAEAYGAGRGTDDERSDELRGSQIDVAA